MVVAAMLLGGCGAGNTQAPSAPETTTAAAPETTTAAPETTTAAAPESTTTASDTPSAGITNSEALEIALKDAGFTQDEVLLSKIGLDIDDGVQKIEVEFSKDDKEYDYDIDPETGAILSKDNEIEDDNNEPVEQYADGAKISDLEALDIAAKDAGVSKDDITSSSVYSGTDDDDGVLEYEIEFHAGNMEYSYDIDAVTGAIRDKSMETDD